MRKIFLGGLNDNFARAIPCRFFFFFFFKRALGGFFFGGGLRGTPHPVRWVHPWHRGVHEVLTETCDK
jgi:hypothetical protein